MDYKEYNVITNYINFEISKYMMGKIELDELIKIIEETKTIIKECDK